MFHDFVWVRKWFAWSFTPRKSPEGDAGVGLEAIEPLAVDDGRDLGRLDFTAAAPEDVGVIDGDAACLEVEVDGAFVLE